MPLLKKLDRLKFIIIILVQDFEDGWPVQGQREKSHLLGHSHFIGRIELMESMIAGFININSVAFDRHTSSPFYIQVLRVSKATRATDEPKTTADVADIRLKIEATRATLSIA